jgi:hypothetical protein
LKPKDVRDTQHVVIPQDADGALPGVAEPL